VDSEYSDATGLRAEVVMTADEGTVGEFLLLGMGRVRDITTPPVDAGTALIVDGRAGMGGGLGGGLR
jgi:hypothetical protein